MSNYQTRLFDGYTVDTEKATFTGFDIEDVDVAQFKADDVLVLVVTATVGGATFKQTKNGDWVRTNKLITHQAKVATGVMKDEIVEFFNLAGDELPFTAVKTSQAPAAQQASTTAPPAPQPSTPVDDDDDEEEDVDPAARDRDWVGDVPAPPAPARGAGAHDPALANFLRDAM